MSEEKQLTVRQELTPDTWQMIKEIAPAMQQSRLFGVASPEAAMAIMLKGYELGLSLTASFEFVQVIQGRPTLSPRGALALIQQSPNFAGMTITDSDDKCTVWMKRKNGFEYTTEFTIEQAKKAGLVKKDSGWDKYPANMLRWRAIGYCADVVFPDIIGGMKRADEFGANITPEGDVWKDVTPIVPETVIEQEPVVIEKPKSDIPDYDWTLQQLLNTVELPDILEVMKNPENPDGVIPAFNEVNLCVHRLIEAGKIASEETDKRVEGKLDDGNGND